MFNRLLTKSYFKAIELIRCNKGVSNELLTAIGLISITVGVLSALSPRIRNGIETITQQALDNALNIFRQTTGGTP